MTFTPEQIKALEAKLDPANIKKNPRGYDYVEGWHVIAEANRIFGRDGWTRETFDLRCAAEYVTGDKHRVSYLARVRIVAQGVIREGCGYGSGIDKDLGQAHESALKEAETDAMKRALMTFGNPFGLALYDKTKSEVGHEEAAPTVSAMEKAAATLLSEQTDATKFKEVWERNKDGWKQGLDRDGYGRLVGIMKTVAAQLQTASPPAPSADNFGIGNDTIPAGFA